MPLTEKKLLRETWCSTSLRIFKGSMLDAEILLENYAVTKYEKNMALGRTDEFSRKNQSEADLHLTYLISRALYRFEL